jgi:hypothetical protein
MDVSFTLDFRNPMRRPWRELWEDNLWLMREAEAMGFDQLLVQGPRSIATCGARVHS